MSNPNISWLSDPWIELLPGLSNCSLTSNPYSTNHQPSPKLFLPYCFSINIISSVTKLCSSLLLYIHSGKCGPHLSRLLKLYPKLLPFDFAPTPICLPNYCQHDVLNNSETFPPMCYIFQWLSIRNDKGLFLGYTFWCAFMISFQPNSTGSFPTTILKAYQLAATTHL